MSKREVSSRVSDSAQHGRLCCVALKLILEVDGEQHHTDEGREHDERRDRYLAEQGYTLLRIPGYQVLQDPASVRCLIETTIDQRIEPLGPLTPGPLSPKRVWGRGETEVASCSIE